MVSSLCIQFIASDLRHCVHPDLVLERHVLLRGVLRSICAITRDLSEGTQDRTQRICIHHRHRWVLGRQFYLWYVLLCAVNFSWHDMIAKGVSSVKEGVAADNTTVFQQILATDSDSSIISQVMNSLHNFANGSGTTKYNLVAFNRWLMH